MLLKYYIIQVMDGGGLENMRRRLVTNSNIYIDKWPDYNVVVKLADLTEPYVYNDPYNTKVAKGVRYNRNSYYWEEDGVEYYEFYYEYVNYVIDSNTKIAVANLPSAYNLCDSFGQFWIGYGEDMDRSSNSSLWKIEQVLKFSPKTYQLGTNEYVFDATGLFYEYKFLKKVDLRAWNDYTNNLELNLNMAFYGCSELEEIYFPNFTLPNINVGTHTFIEMFKNCSKLKKVDFGKFITSKSSSIDMNNMFYGCSSLQYIRCTLKLKDMLQNKGYNNNLPIAMQEGGSGTWEIIEE